jgi:hypothetical protein
VEVAALVNQQTVAGNYSITWNALEIPSGVYFYHITAGNYSEIKKMILLK